MVAFKSQDDSVVQIFGDGRNHRFIGVMRYDDGGRLIESRGRCADLVRYRSRPWQSASAASF